MIKFIQYTLFLFGFIGIILIGMLLNEAAPGSSIFFWIVIFFFLLYCLKRYPKEEVFAVIGIAFGFICIFVIGGAYLIIISEYEFLALVWFVFWMAILIIFKKSVTKKLTPTLFLADEFAKIVGPIPLHSELPKGCGIIAIESLLFFFLLMTAQLLAPILWLVHLLLLLWFLKFIRSKGFSFGKLVIFILINIIVISLLWIIFNQLGIERSLRVLMSG